jgi:hypothetical protein
VWSLRGACTTVGVGGHGLFCPRPRSVWGHTQDNVPFFEPLRQGATTDYCVWLGPSRPFVDRANSAGTRCMIQAWIKACGFKRVVLLAGANSVGADHF